MSCGATTRIRLSVGASPIFPSSQEIRLRNSAANFRGDPTTDCKTQHSGSTASARGRISSSTPWTTVRTPAVHALFQSVRGLPRLVNRIAHYALTVAAAAVDARTVNAGHLEHAVEELRLSTCPTSSSPTSSATDNTSPRSAATTTSVTRPNAAATTDSSNSSTSTIERSESPPATFLDAETATPPP